MLSSLAKICTSVLLQIGFIIKLSLSPRAKDRRQLGFLSGMTIWGGFGVTAEVEPASGASVTLRSDVELCLCKLPGPSRARTPGQFWGLRLYPEPATWW